MGWLCEITVIPPQYMSSEMAAMQSPPAYPSPGPNYPVAMYPTGRHPALPPDKRE